MIPPPNTKTYESEIGTYWFDTDGILICQSKSPTRTVENIKANVELIQKIGNGKKVCLLIYIANSKKPSKETRAYVNEQLPKIYSAMAMMTKSGLGKIIMGFLFKKMGPPIPIKMFSDEKKAKEWLMEFQ